MSVSIDGFQKKKCDPAFELSTRRLLGFSSFVYNVLQQDWRTILESNQQY